MMMFEIPEKASLSYPTTLLLKKNSDGYVASLAKEFTLKERF